MIDVRVYSYGAVIRVVVPQKKQIVSIGMIENYL